MIKMLSGNEAVARRAWEAGVAVASAYPGTPSTEILENLACYPNVYAEWAPNEKVAVDVAIGAAYAGKRAMATMKHVGLNVAADSFMYAALTGAEAGLVIFVTADDPQERAPALIPLGLSARPLIHLIFAPKALSDLFADSEAIRKH